MSKNNNTRLTPFAKLLFIVAILFGLSRIPGIKEFLMSSLYVVLIAGGVILISVFIYFWKRAIQKNIRIMRIKNAKKQLGVEAKIKLIGNDTDVFGNGDLNTAMLCVADGGLSMLMDLLNPILKDPEKRDTWTYGGGFLSIYSLVAQKLHDGQLGSVDDKTQWVDVIQTLEPYAKEYINEKNLLAPDIIPQKEMDKLFSEVAKVVKSIK